MNKTMKQNFKKPKQSHAHRQTTCFKKMLMTNMTKQHWLEKQSRKLYFLSFVLFCFFSLALKKQRFDNRRKNEKQIISLISRLNYNEKIKSINRLLIDQFNQQTNDDDEFQLQR